MSSDLAVACRKGDLKQVELLLIADANPNRNDKWGTTPLQLASRNGHLEITELLLKAGADLNQANILGDTPLY